LSDCTLEFKNARLAYRKIDRLICTYVHSSFDIQKQYSKAIFDSHFRKFSFIFGFLVFSAFLFPHLLTLGPLGTLSSIRYLTMKSTRPLSSRAMIHLFVLHSFIHSYRPILPTRLELSIVIIFMLRNVFLIFFVRLKHK